MLAAKVLDLCYSNSLVMPGHWFKQDHASSLMWKPGIQLDASNCLHGQSTNAGFFLLSYHISPSYRSLPTYTNLQQPSLRWNWKSSASKTKGKIGFTAQWVKGSQNHGPDALSHNPAEMFAERDQDDVVAPTVVISEVGLPLISLNFLKRVVSPKQGTTSWQKHFPTIWTVQPSL